MESDPVISVIVPAYNQFEQTTKCLVSLKNSNTNVPFEILLVDDCSEDRRFLGFTKIKGIRYIRNKKNLGYLKSCNEAAKLVRGKYILLLNNDTEGTQNFINELLEIFERCPKAGAVGSKLVYPSGELQEAGGIIWEDGSGWNFGKGDNPENPKYNYVREVDYCSGACLLIKKDIWKKVGGFDENFAPAYYEDTDLCFKVRKIGYSVIYQPFSKVIHYEGLSSGTDINLGVKSYQRVNQQKFKEKWKNELILHQRSDMLNELQIRNRFDKYYVLFIDATTPTPDKDSGSVDAHNFMMILRELGCAVTFIPYNLAYFDEYTVILQKKGIEVQYFPFIKSIETFLLEKGDFYDYIILSRITVAQDFIHTIRNNLKRPKIIFNTVDLHFLRKEREALLGNYVNLFEEVYKLRQKEIETIKLSDFTLLVSEKEMEVVKGIVPSAKTILMPIPRIILGKSKGFDGREGIVFLGGFQHLPNVDAVEYFLSNIWPIVRNNLRYTKFLIAGSNMPEKFQELDGKDGVQVIGYVKDLDNLFNKVKISIAPLRYGAGVKGKIVTSLSFGVPCVATTLAIEGMRLIPDEHILTADTPDTFSNCIVRLYTDSTLWEKLSNNGLTFVSKNYSIDSAKEVWKSIISKDGEKDYDEKN